MPILNFLNICTKLTPKNSTNLSALKSKFRTPILNFLNICTKLKPKKLDQLIGPQITSDSSPENLKTLVTIPENLLLLSDSEKSFLSKGLNFVPLSKRKSTNLKLSKTLKNPFPAFTKFSSLSLEEWSALKSVKKNAKI